jgi:hypothetical protein
MRSFAMQYVLRKIQDQMRRNNVILQESYSSKTRRMVTLQPAYFSEQTLNAHLVASMLLMHRHTTLR